MTIRNAIVAVAIATLLGAGAASAAQTFNGAQYLSQAKVTLDEARATAMKARPGQITDQELEKEDGGSGLRYSFDIKAGDGVYEIGVDAQSGKVLQNSKEGKNPD